MARSFVPQRDPLAIVSWPPLVKRIDGPLVGMSLITVNLMIHKLVYIAIHCVCPGGNHLDVAEAWSSLWLT